MNGGKELLAAAIILFIGCSEHSTSDLIGPSPDVVRYATHVRPLLERLHAALGLAETQIICAA